MAVTTKRRSLPQGEPQPWAVRRFLEETFDELRKVVWPTPQELYRYTMVVIATVVVIATFIGAVDAGLAEVARRFIYAGVNGAAPIR